MLKKAFLSLKNLFFFFYYIPNKLFTIKHYYSKCRKEKTAHADTEIKNKHCSVSYVMDSGFARHLMILRFHILVL